MANFDEHHPDVARINPGDYYDPNISSWTMEMEKVILQFLICQKEGVERGAKKAYLSLSLGMIVELLWERFRIIPPQIHERIEQMEMRYNWWKELLDTHGVFKNAERGLVCIDTTIVKTLTDEVTFLYGDELASLAVACILTKVLILVYRLILVRGLKGTIICRTRTANQLFFRTRFSNLSIQKPLLRGSLGLTRFGLGQVPDPENAELVIRDLFGRVEGFLYTIADAAVNSSDTVDAVSTTKQNSDWLSGITNAMEVVLKVLKDGLSTLHVPYSYGFAIILLTVLVKAATFPLSKKQVESAMAMQSLTPQIKAIQERYAGDQERIQLETARLYKLAGINPLAGCLPTLATIPIWIGLYRALSNVADEGLLTEGFFWIPSLSGPTSIVARQTGSGTSWLFPFIDGHPPLGWPDTFAYLVLPLLLIISQYISVQIMQPQQSNDPNVKTSQAITNFLPLMIGYFALSVPSGLSLYWFTNNILSTAQQVWLRKMGGAKNPVNQFSDDSIKKEQPTVLKTISEAPVASTVVEKEEKPTSQGFRPGDRFKQLKEQEARRKKQREEENMKTLEVAAEESQITNGEVNKDINLLKNGFVLNGNSANSGVKDDKTETALVSEGEKPEISDDNENERFNLHLDKNVEKENKFLAVRKAKEKD
ncbi:ALBINO3-like protein 1, chloroplastic [Castilleja foliolosa]|uniref:ALBINO3-like protein 1, chloroplastic n=1 Tax=Castilleja foliolosa TaxID=1961234 RepID=A0ABD3E5S7_9LAMI